MLSHLEYKLENNRNVYTDHQCNKGFASQLPLIQVQPASEGRLIPKVSPTKVFCKANLVPSNFP